MSKLIIIRGPSGAGKSTVARALAENYAFYLQASLAETVRRHQTRSVKIISEQEMNELYRYATPMHHPSETIVPENSSLQETVHLIRRTAEI